MNPVVHFEIPYENAERASAFYCAAFGWQTQQYGPEMGNYVVLTTATKDVLPTATRGSINGGLYQKKAGFPEQHPSIVIGVDNVQTAMRAVRDAGGEVLGEPVQIPEVGLYVSFLDTEGNRNSLLQPSPTMKK